MSTRSLMKAGKHWAFDKQELPANLAHHSKAKRHLSYNMAGAKNPDSEGTFGMTFRRSQHQGIDKK